MSTIPVNPFDETKPETGPAISPSTADQRAQHAAGNAAFAAAKTDVEALETGKEDAGTAAAAVAAHDASGAAHGGVEAAHAAHVAGQVNTHATLDAHLAAANPHADSASLTDLTNHKTNGASQHPVATTGAGGEGFLRALSGNGAEYLDGAGNWSTPPGGGGTVHTVSDAVDTVIGRPEIRFEATGDASVDVQDDPANDRVRVIVDATAGAGGGGIGKGTPFVVGDILEASSAAGDGQARTTSISSASVSTHLASVANPHAVTHAQTGPDADEHVAHSAVSISAGDGLTGGGTIAASRVLSANYAGSGGNLGSALTLARSDHAHAGVYEPVGALRNVIEDTTPQLGGDLETLERDIVITKADGTILGSAGHLLGLDGVYLARHAEAGVYDPNDGGVSCEAGVINLHGATAVVESLKHATAGGREVMVAENGGLYAVDPPPPGWSDSDTDPGFYARSGVGLNVWQQITGLTATVAQPVAPGEPFDVSASIFTRNTTSNRTGVVEIGFGINGAQPIAGAQAYPIVELFAGFLNYSIRTAAVTLAASDTVEVWVRVTSESNAQFSTGLQFDGSAGNDHELFIGVPGGGAGGGSGDVVQGSGGADGEIGVWQSWAGKTIGGTGILAANLAVTHQANTFTGDQTVTRADGTALTITRSHTGTGLLEYVHETDSTSLFEWFQIGNGTPNERHFAHAIFGGQMLWISSDDARGSQIALLRIDHDQAGGHVDCVTGELREQGVRVISPAVARDIDAGIGYAFPVRQVATGTAGSTWVPDPKAGPNVQLTDTTSATIGALASPGVVTVIVPADKSLTFAAPYFVAGAQAPGKRSMITLSGDGTTASAVIAPES